MEKKLTTVGLVIRSAPLAGKRSREQLDIALSAASLGFELQLFFVGAGVAQLSAGKGHKGWKALPGLTTVTAWIDPGALESLQNSGDQSLLEVKATDHIDMAKRVSQCDQVMAV